MGRGGSAAVLLNADPPDHRRQRVLVNARIRRRSSSALEPKVHEVAASLLDAFADPSAADSNTGRRTVDIVSQFTIGLPMAIIAHALGVGDEDLARFKRWSDDLVMPVGNSAPSVEQTRGYLVSTKEFAEYFAAKLADRRAHPTGDIISDVANAELDGEKLSEAEMLGMLQQFLVAETRQRPTCSPTSSTTSPSIPTSRLGSVRIARSWTEWSRQALRFEAPVGGLFRQARVDVEVGRG